MDAHSRCISLRRLFAKLKRGRVIVTERRKANTCLLDIVYVRVRCACLPAPMAKVRLALLAMRAPSPHGARIGKGDVAAAGVI
jgi:hypothetical protein